MNTSSSHRAWHAALVAALLLVCVAALAAVAPGAPGAPGAAQRSANVELAFRDPARIVAHDNSWNDRNEWLDELGRYVVEQSSARVPEGMRLLVTIDDVQRAGMVEPWRRHGLSDVSIVRDSTPPRIELSFQLVAPQGAVLKEGRRDLSDLNFLHRSSFHSGERLAFEKDLIDDWLRRDLAPPRR